MSDIVISSFGSVSPLGAGAKAVRSRLSENRTAIAAHEIGGEEVLVAALDSKVEAEIDAIRAEPRYSSLDRSVHLAIHAARSALRGSNLSGSSRTGVNIGSSRGATGVLEQVHGGFLKSGKVPTATSPISTLGNISSWVSQDLMLGGFSMSHSVTCSTGMHAILNAIAWIKSEMCDRVLAGASEAALTPFTVAQMKALRIYSNDFASPFPCRPLGDLSTANDGMVLGEGAAVALLETRESAIARGVPGGDLIGIEGFGFAVEQIQSATGISESGEGFEAAMRMAIEKLPAGEKVDCVVLHAPGTKKGDEAELQALQRVFESKLPALTSNKWMIGHTFAAAGLFGVELAIEILRGLPPPPFPYPTLSWSSSLEKTPKRVLVNAAGFGGNTVSLLLRAA